MTFNELKKKRGFTVGSSFTDGKYVTFKTSNKNLAYEAMRLMEENGIKTSGDICGGKAVGGYYVSGFTKELI